MKRAFLIGAVAMAVLILGAWMWQGGTTSGTVIIQPPYYLVLGTGNGATDVQLKNTAGNLSISGPELASGTAAGLTGTGACATITTQAGGSWAGTGKCTGTTGASTLIITPGTTAPNGWNCNVQDITTRANLFQQTADNTTTCTLTVTSVTQNDVFVFEATAF